MAYISYNEFLRLNRINESEDMDIVQTPQEYGCLMAYFEIDEWDSVISQINPEDVYGEEPEYGIERQPHATILYGFHLDTTDPDDIESAIENISIGTIDDIEIIGIDKFENDEYDVLKISIKSEKLTKLNEYFSESFDYSNDYPDYNPHITIAYMEKGKADDYMDMDIDFLTETEDDDNSEEEIENPFYSDRLVYSFSKTQDEDEKISIYLHDIEDSEDSEEMLDDNMDDNDTEDDEIMDLDMGDD